MTDREQLALAEPPANLDGFPTATVTDPHFRAHSIGRSPWWFSHDGSGRFDLRPPDGTCYMASHVAAAVLERLGETLVRAGRVSGAEADRMEVSRLPTDVVVADTTTNGATRFGLTRELGSVTPYDLPRRWASALRNAQKAGILYWPRFSLSPEHRGLALFGPAGEDTERLVDAHALPGRSAARVAGVAVFDPPRSVTVTQPPKR